MFILRTVRSIWLMINIKTQMMIDKVTYKNLCNCDIILSISDFFHQCTNDAHKDLSFWENYAKITKFQSYTFLLYNCKKNPACVYVLVRILVLSMHFLPEKTIYDNFSYCFISVSNTLICYGIFPKNCCKIYLFTYLFYSFVYIGSIWCHSGAIFIISLKSVKKWHFSYRFSNGK